MTPRYRLCELCGTVHRHSCSTEFFLYGVLCGIGYAIAYVEIFK